MYFVCVRLEVKPEKVPAFLELATFNARNSRTEPGNVRFDVLRSVDPPNLFRLHEIYRDEAAFLEHQKTPHYARWKEEIPGLLAAPRQSEKFVNVFPDPYV